MNYQELHLPIKPCSDAIEYIGSQPNAEAVWDNCERGDWLLWWTTLSESFQYGSKRHRLLVKMACVYGMLSLPCGGKYREDLVNIYTDLVAWCQGDDGKNLDKVYDLALAVERSQMTWLVLPEPWLAIPVVYIVKAAMEVAWWEVAAWLARSVLSSAVTIAMMSGWSLLDVHKRYADIVRTNFTCPAVTKGMGI